MTKRAIGWLKEQSGGTESADVNIARGRLTASGRASGSDPVAYRLEYKLETRSDYITSGLLVVVRGEGWSRTLDLRRLVSGRWTARTSTRGRVELPKPGGDMSAFSKALDCDLALSPLTNSMPVLRHGLLEAGGPVELLMAWVSVPDLAVSPSRQRYTFLRKSGDLTIVRYESASTDFAADITFDSAGLVVTYPGLARRSG